MQVPLQIDFSNVDHSDAVEARIRDRVARLERVHDRITTCRVHVRAPHHHHRHGYQYAVSIELVVPEAELVVNHKPGDINAHRDIYVAVRDAFDAMERQLKKHTQQARGDVKTHNASLLQGRIVELHPEADFGQIETTDNRLIYFHRNSIVDTSLEKLALGDTVELSVHYGESADGPQAGTVRRIGPMNYVPDPKSRIGP